MFLNYLEYKCKKEGKIFLQIDRFFPSSKTCNHCLNVVDSLPLDVRSWDCPSCKTRGIDRDINAAKNCRDEGIRLLSCGTRDTAKGRNVRQRRGRKSTVVAVVDDFGSPHRTAQRVGVGQFTKTKSQTAQVKQGIQSVDIIVDGGYTPDRIEVSAGEPVKLNFFRKDHSSCLEQVLLPDFNQALDLTLNQTTTVEILPEKPGEYIFTCGMNMYRGVIIAEDLER